MAQKLETTNYYFDEVEVGDYFETSSRTVTETDLVMFSGLSGDYTLLHTDAEYAASTAFGGRIAHGCLILSIATGLSFRIGQDMSRVVAFYGMDNVRFTAPVHIGDTISMTGEIISLQDKGEKGGVVTRRDSIKNQRGETVAVLDKRLLHKKKP